MADVMRLGDLASSSWLIINDGYRTKKAELGMPGVPVLRVAEVQDGYITPTFGDHVSENYRQHFANKTSRGGDIVVTTKGTVGRVARIGPTDPQFVYSPQLCFFRVLDETRIDPGFLYQWFRGFEFRRQALGVQSQTDMAPYINLADMRNLRITLPPLSEQRAIAEALGALDDKIESNGKSRSLIAEYSDTAWRKLVRNGASTTVDLASLVAFNANTVKPGPPEEVISYVDISSVKPDKVEEVRRVAWSEAPSRARRSVIDGDMIFSTVRPERRSFALVVDPEPGTVVSTGFATLTPTKIGPAFLHAVLSDRAFSDHCQASAQGTAYPAVNPEAMGKFPVQLPDSVRLRSFEDEIMPMLRMSQTLTLESNTLERLRNTLLPELLSGRLRARAISELVEA